MLAFMLGGYILGAAIDGNVVGIGGLSGALVVATGYMLRDRRDTDTRVDKATQTVIDNIAGERDRALQAERDTTVELKALQKALEDANERTRIVQFRLQIAEAELERMKGQRP